MMRSHMKRKQVRVAAAERGVRSTFYTRLAAVVAGGADIRDSQSE